MREILLVGNPNAGKTTLFNSLTKSDEHVGNWHGVTVENKSKAFKHNGEEFVLVDTPGLYSLKPLSFEEAVSSKTILEDRNRKVINICDQNNLQRNLYLTLCLIEQGCDVVVAINETSKKPILKVDPKKLGDILGVDVVLINAEKAIGLEKLKNCLSNKQNARKLAYFSNLKGNEIDDSKTRYDFIDKIMQKVAVSSNNVYGKSKIDKILLNKWMAFPIFMLIMSAIFYLTFFSLGSFFSELLGSFLELISSPILNCIKNYVGNSWIYDLFNVAIFGGVSTVISFLPQVVLLFLFLSILEDSGYLSRVAFVFEDILGKIGLSGKSVYTLLMGFGCSTTAIMTARNMDDKNAKIKTAILCPYMSCSAKIPIYTVIGGAFFGAKNLLVIISLYALGVILSLLISTILEKTMLKSEKQTFILEFPPYRFPSAKRIIRIVWKNLKSFIGKVSTVMISMNIIVWLLSSFSFNFVYVPASGGVSMLESFGKLLAPLFSPLGFGNWAVVSALLAGLVAKEVVVSSIAMFNGIDASATKLLSESLLLSSSVVFFSSKASVLSFLVFCLLYTPCIASIAMLFHEIGKKWTFVSIAIQLLTAYVVAFVVYNIAFAFEVFGFLKPFFVILALFLIFFAFFFVARTIKKRKSCKNCLVCNMNCKNKK